MRSSERWDLRTGVRRRRAGALVRWFVVACDGAGTNGRRGAGVAVGDARGFAVAVAAVCVAIGGVGVEGADGVDETGGVVKVAGVAGVVGVGVGVDDMGVVVDVGDIVSVAVVVAAAGDVVGDGGVGDSAEACVVDAAVAVAVAVEVAVGGRAGAAVAETQGLRGASDVGGDGLGGVEVEGVRQKLKRRVLRHVDAF